MTRDLVAFDEPIGADIDLRALLGGKAAGLIEMTRDMQLSVPPGFAITTDVCREYLRSGWPSGLDARIDHYLDHIGEQLGRGFGDPARPLLVSVRSGAPVSMPGMMDTLLNVGITPEIRDRLAETTGSPVFAADTWLRFNTMYASIVLGIAADELAGVRHPGPDAGALNAAADRVRELARPYGGIPRDPRDQLKGAIEAVFRSWNAERARVFRQREGISEDLGTAVTVQAMVFGNMDDQSGTGVAFTRDPATGDPEPYGDYLPRAQGEDVVAGTHAVRGLALLHEQLPAVYQELRETLARLERHYRDMCDVEFTVSEGQLYVLQTRPGRRSPLAAARIAVHMAEDPAFPLTREEAVSRVGQSVLHELATSGTVNPAAEPLAHGLPASPGVGAGVLSFDPEQAAQLADDGTSVVLAREQTSPADVHGMVGAAGIVTLLGGVASHAAVVARSWSIPAVTSLQGATIDHAGLHIGGTAIAAGETVTVDGTTGALFLGDQQQHDATEYPEVNKLREWAAELGREPGPETPATSSAPVGARSASLYEIARTVQLKGLCDAERVAAALQTPVATVEEALAENESMFRNTPRGAMLLPGGRTWVEEQLAAERAAIDTATLDGIYERFLPLNHRFKQLVTAWQQTSSDAQDDAAWTALLAESERLHRDFAEVLSASADVASRLATYPARFEQALQAMRDGDTSMLAAPLKDSYHTVWFEFHEELIVLCGRDRAAEERAENTG